MRRDTFELVIGVNPGYFHDNECTSALQAVIDAWDRVSVDPPHYIPAVMSLAKVVYRKEWGCPEGGEDVVVIKGSRNQAFAPDDFDWSVDVMAQCMRLREELRQTTATLTFSEADFYYLK